MNAIVNNTTKTFIAEENTVVLVEKFQTHARKTAESILEMGKIVFEAKKLVSSQFCFFCESIGFDHKSPTIRKFVSIGEKYELLISKSKNLPASWTTIYEVAVLGNEVIEDYISDGSINHTTTGKDLKSLIGKNKIVLEKPETNKVEENQIVQNGALEGYAFMVKLDKAPDQLILKKLAKILKELDLLNIKYELAPSLDEFMTESV